MKVLAFSGRMGTGKDTAAQFFVDRGYCRIGFADAMKFLARFWFEFTDEELFGPSEARERTDKKRGTREFWQGVWFRAGHDHDQVQRMMSRAPTSVRMREVPDGLPLSDSYFWRHVQQQMHRYLASCEAKGAALTPRWALQQMGTEFGRSVWPGVWIDVAFQTMRTVETQLIPYEVPRGLQMDRSPLLNPPPGYVITDCRFPNEVRAVRERGGSVYWIDATQRVDTTAFRHVSEPDLADVGGVGPEAITAIIDNNYGIEYLHKQLEPLL